MKRSISLKTVLQKISNNEDLNKQDKKILGKFVSVLKKSLKGKSLSDTDRELIKETIQKSEAGMLKAEDLITFASRVFQLWEIFKDYS